MVSSGGSCRARRRCASTPRRYPRIAGGFGGRQAASQGLGDLRLDRGIVRPAPGRAPLCRGHDDERRLTDRRVGDAAAAEVCRRQRPELRARDWDWQRIGARASEEHGQARASNGESDGRQSALFHGHSKPKKRASEFQFCDLGRATRHIPSRFAFEGNAAISRNGPKVVSVGDDVGLPAVVWRRLGSR